MITLKLKQNQIQQIHKDYLDGSFRYDIAHTQFQVKMPGITITAYKSGSVVFAGNDAFKHARAYDPSIQNESLIKAKDKPKQSFPMAGSDEVGTGDYFGPVTVCACYLDEEMIQNIPVEEIVDSKELNDHTVLNLAPLLMKELTFSLLILDNKKYNEIHQKHNMNAIKAILHNQAFIHLSKKVTLPKDNVIIDQFLAEAPYFKHLENENEIFKDLQFVTKAENQYLAVACAAIIARYAFLEQLKIMEEHYQCNLPKGAGPRVDHAAVKFVEKHGLDALNSVAKTHFKNSDKVKELLLKEHPLDS